MVDNNNSSKQYHKEKKEMKKHSGSGIVGCAYFMAFIGAAVYYIQSATSFGMGVVGFLKAIVWPAFLVYNVLQYINM